MSFRTIAYSSSALFGQKPLQAVSFRTKAFADCIFSDKSLCRLYPFGQKPLQAVSLSDINLCRLYPFGPLPLQALSFRTIAFAGSILSDHCLCRLYPFGSLPLQALSFRTIAFAGCILSDHCLGRLYPFGALFDLIFLSASCKITKWSTSFRCQQASKSWAGATRLTEFPVWSHVNFPIRRHPAQSLWMSETFGRKYRFHFGFEQNCLSTQHTANLDSE